MLFDLSGKRKRFVQVAYTILAVLFFVGFVGFSVGSEVQGGLFDAFGGRDGPSGGQYEQEIEDAEERLELDPENREALLTIARYRFLAGQQQLEVEGEEGQPRVTEDSRAELTEAADAWERYLETEPRNPDDGIASQMVQAFQLLEDAEGAARAQRVVAEARPSEGTFSTLAFYHYAAGELDEGDDAAKLAVDEAPSGEARQIERQLKQIRRQAKRFAEAQEALGDQGPDAGSQLQNPFGGLGTGP